jgi:tungstate transport system ATP-binding protein
VLSIDDLVVRSGEVLTIIGPNGAGKSTLLLAMSGLLPPKSGEIRFRGSPVTSRTSLSYRRQISLVLQKAMLINSSVIENVMLGARFRHTASKERRERAELWLQRFGVIHLMNRSAKSLSGGEAQRVSLARAFTANPEIIFLDEPFSALDAPTRSALLEDFQSLLAETKITTVFITHDMDEALHLSDRMGVLLSGELRQIDSPDTVFSSPADPEVAAFVGLDTTVFGQVTGAHDGMLNVRVGDSDLAAIGDVPVGRTVLFCIRPEDVTLWSDDRLPVSSARNRLAGTITKLTSRGPSVQVSADCGFPIRILVTRSSAREMGLTLGMKVALTFKASAVHLIPH